jgi:hypothetical protein
MYFRGCLNGTFPIFLESDTVQILYHLHLDHEETLVIEQNKYVVNEHPIYVNSILVTSKKTQLHKTSQNLL